ncbi:hypothetical protein LTR64_004727 [Lithohypha guttulata]|uniref:uncharacterized protein n=1 Tax=Lithohypha guttulata TaxID=1690604 RepID=UPI002DE0A747|nr:hypothetical protein LTR51_005976 [Lithohypha guttulata]
MAAQVNEVTEVQPITVFASCHAYVNYAELLWQSIGPAPGLCDWFDEAITARESCNSSRGKSRSSSVTVELNVPVSYCSLDFEATTTPNNFTSSIISIPDFYAWVSSCNSYLNNNQTADPSASSLCNVIVSASSASPTTPSASSSSSSTAIPSQTAAATTVPTSPNLSTGAIAGLAVGAALGGILPFSLVLFFIWRRRRKAERKKAAQADVAATESREEKAQLYLDDYQPTREELEGMKVPRTVREVGGLNKLEHEPLYRTCSELPANEVAGAEMRSDMSPTTDSSTLVDSSASNRFSQ